VGTYKLKPGFKPGAYGKKMVGLAATGNVLSDRMAEVFSAVVEPEVAPKAAKTKKAKPAKESK
jgi:hypothetical protein